MLLILLDQKSSLSGVSVLSDLNMLQDLQINQKKARLTLIYTVGAKADDIFQSFSLSTEKQKKYDTVVPVFRIISLLAEM